MYTRKKSNSLKRRRNKQTSYGTLEDRNLLATLTALNPASGVLSIDLTANNDIAVIDIASNGNVIVNGSEDLNSTAVGSQTVNASDLDRIVIDGDASRTGQQVSIAGHFVGIRELTSAAINNVNQITVNGTLELTGNFDASLSGSGGRIGDATNGRLRIGGTTTIDAGDNGILLNNTGNDFNIIGLNTTGGEEAVVTDFNQIAISQATTSDDLVITAGGGITDTEGADITVLRDAYFTASSVELGDNADDTTNFRRSAFDVAGHVELQEDSNTTFLTSDVGSLTVRSDGGIFDGRTTEVHVDGLAQLFGTNRIRIGEHGSDTFNAGSLQFQTNGHAHIFENSNTVIVGDNNARSLDLLSFGNVTDSNTASINVRRHTGIQSNANVVLGDTANDQFNSGTLYFFTTGDFFVTEDSSSHIIETKNFADRFSLTSAGAITDADDARIKVNRLANFDAVSVNVGDTQDDLFNAGSVQFKTTGQFKISENSALNISGNNVAGNTIINANGDITDADDARVNIAGSSSFFGDNILLGNTQDDLFNAGAITFKTAADAVGTVNISEDSSTAIGGRNSATTLRLNSDGAITDGPSAEIAVTGNARLTTANNGGIVIGDSGTLANGTPFDSSFQSASLTVQTDGTGNVLVEEDGDIFLAGVNRANSMTLVANDGNGTIRDNATAQIDVARNLDVTGSFINLGTGVEDGSNTDRLALSSLTFTSNGNVNLSAETSFFLTGESRTGGFLTLASTGSVRSAGDSETMVQTGAQLIGIDVMIGNLADDCFDIINSGINGNKNLTVNASGSEDVTLGC